MFLPNKSVHEKKCSHKKCSSNNSSIKTDCKSTGALFWVLVRIYPGLFQFPSHEKIESSSTHMHTDTIIIIIIIINL